MWASGPPQDAVAWADAQRDRGHRARWQPVLAVHDQLIPPSRTYVSSSDQFLILNAPVRFGWDVKGNGWCRRRKNTGS
jgi:hypothetical protein